MIYVYRCVDHTIEANCPMGEQPETLQCPQHDDVQAKRCYACEGKRLNGLDAMKKERDPNWDPRLFLPTHETFAKEAAIRGEHDPTGEKGMKKWMEEHEPVSKNPIDPRKL